MKKVLFAVMLTVTVCSISYAGSAINALKGSAGPLPVVEAVSPPSPVSVEKVPGDALTTVLMDQTDIPVVIGIFNRVHVKGRAQNADCYSTEAVIESRVRSFNPAKWSIIFVNSENFTKGKRVVALTETEIPSMIAMFDRLHVAVSRLNGIDLVSQVTITSRSCNLRPAVWTVRYYDKTNSQIDMK